MDKAQICHDLTIMKMNKESFIDDVQMVKSYFEYNKKLLGAYDDYIKQNPPQNKAKVVDIKDTGIW